MSDTVEIGGKDVSRHSIENALDFAVDDDGVAQDSIGRYDTVWVIGDPDPDDWVTVLHSEHGKLTHTPAESLYDTINEDFETYLRENVFVGGTYTYDEVGWSEISVAEHDDGSGFVLSSDMRRLQNDDRVSILSVKDGWLNLTDQR